MKEFGFYNDFNDTIMLNEQIDVVSNEQDGEYLISNSPKLKSKVVASEINFYLRNSKDSMLNKAKNTLALYEVHANTFDLAKDTDHNKLVGRNIVLVSNTGRETLAAKLREAEFKVIELTHFEVKFVYGAVGELGVIILQANDEFEIDADFLLVENARDYMLKQSGCFEIANLSDETVLNLINQKSPNYEYKTHIHYDSTICQYHERRHEVCGKCAEVCPTVAILKDDEKKHLVFSHIDCLGCGGCISVCPSGALDYSHMPRISLNEAAKYYKDKTVLIVPRKMDISNLNIELPQGVLPFGIEGEKWLHEAHFMTLLQESGASVVFYTDLVSKGSKDAISIVNQIYELKFNKKAVYVAMNESELASALAKAGSIEGSYYSMSEYAMTKREIFAKRTVWLVGESNLGIVKTGTNVSYGRVEINRDTCTLCLSCVGACNTSALVADKKTNSIMFNPSICTDCGYCEMSCAEKDTIKITSGQIALEPKFFEYNELAHDELFACIECGKEFATKKSVEKIANLMLPKFASDPIRQKTLYCCADCKAKVMIKAQIQTMNKDILNG